VITGEFNQARSLIVKTSSMGDVIHAMPALSDLLVHRPDLAVDWAVEESFADLVRLHPGVTNVLPVAVRRWRQQVWSKDTHQDVRRVKQLLSSRTYQKIVDCQGLLKSAWVTRQARGVRYGYNWSSARESLASLAYDHRFPVSRELHAIERCRRLFAQVFEYIYPAYQLPRFGLKAPETSDIAEHLPTEGSYAVLLTNASRETKRWPDESWQQVARFLEMQGLSTVYIAGTAVERERTTTMMRSTPGGVLLPSSGLADLAYVLANAHVVIGLDTGLTHLAAALGRPVIGIFCDYDPNLVGLCGDGECRSLGSVRGGPNVNEVLHVLSEWLK